MPVTRRSSRLMASAEALGSAKTDDTLKVEEPKRTRSRRTSKKPSDASAELPQQEETVAVEEPALIQEPAPAAPTTPEAQKDDAKSKLKNLLRETEDDSVYDSLFSTHKTASSVVASPQAEAKRSPAKTPITRPQAAAAEEEEAPQEAAPAPVATAATEEVAAAVASTTKQAPARRRCATLPWLLFCALIIAILCVALDARSFAEQHASTVMQYAEQARNYDWQSVLDKIKAKFAP